MNLMFENLIFQLCQEEDVNALCWLVPEVYGLFPDIVVGHPEILHIIVAAIDAQQLQDIVYLVLQVCSIIFSILITTSIMNRNSFELLEH